jgi:hypothetical protein
MTPQIRMIQSSLNVYSATNIVTENASAYTKFVGEYTTFFFFAEKMSGSCLVFILSNSDVVRFSVAQVGDLHSDILLLYFQSSLVSFISDAIFNLDIIGTSFPPALTILVLEISFLYEYFSNFCAALRCKKIANRKPNSA